MSHEAAGHALRAWPAAELGRVCQAWHSTSEVPVLVPGIRGAQGQEKGKGIHREVGSVRKRGMKMPGNLSATGREISRRMASERASQRAFVGVSALLFAASAAATIVWCASMPAMGEMPMPGGWTMSRAWMRMPAQTWPAAGASFLGMWVVMMVAMRLPSLVPMLWRYRQAVGRTGETHLGWLTALVGVGYFFVWTVFGMAAFPLGVALAAAEMQLPVLARAAPIAVGVVVLIAGAPQFGARCAIAASHGSAGYSRLPPPYTIWCACVHWRPWHEHIGRTGHRSTS
jgi:Predicted metal-binding integral membrane protein (DUF2182)